MMPDMGPIRGVWMRWAGDRTELMTETPQECVYCRRMTCFFTNKDGQTTCSGCEGRNGR